MSKAIGEGIGMQEEVFMKNCPNCQAMLEEIVVQGIAIDGCPRCGGTWFEGTELTELVRRDFHLLGDIEHRFQDTRPEAFRTAGPKKCPLCQAPLFAFHFRHTPEVSLEGCRQCKGLWVDDGKLSQLEARLAAQQAAAAPARTPAPAAPAPTPAAPAPSPPAEFLYTCPACEEPNPLGPTQCRKCGAELPITHTRTDRRCPLCNDVMMREKRAGIPVQTCFNREGIWLHERFFRAMLQSHREMLPALERDLKPIPDPAAGPDHPLQCSACQVNLLIYELVVPLQEMYNFNTQVRVSRCPLCNGMWFLPGQLTLLHQRLTEREAELAREQQEQADSQALYY